MIPSNGNSLVNFNEKEKNELYFPHWYYESAFYEDRLLDERNLEVSTKSKNIYWNKFVVILNTKMSYSY